MGDEKGDGSTPAQVDVCVVEATDENGSLVSRAAFPSQAECDAHAAELKAKDYKVAQSSLQPK